jgi:phosphoribosylformylglycinamidine cyclo-ligase
MSICEMYRTFNCGIGMVIAIPAGTEQQAMEILRASGEQPFVVGKIAAATGDEPAVELAGL